MAEKRATVARPADILVGKGLLAVEALKGMEEEAMASGVALEKYLVEKNLVPANAMTLAISEYLGMPPISLGNFTPNSELVESVPKAILTKHQVVPIARLGKTVTVAMGDPFDIMAIEALHIATGMEITPVAASGADVKRALEKAMASDVAAVNMEDIMKGGDEIEVGSSQEEESQLSLEDMMESAGDRPVIRMVNMILIEAIKLGANDIHIEPQEDFVRLRYRVDGLLLERPSLPKALQSAIVSRVKIMADLDIGEQRIPQDGRFRISAMGKAIDVRVSILPTIFGGRVVMRTLDKSALFPNLAALGLAKGAYDALSYAIAQPHGIVLVTGPTGSGKTTTLYSCLQELNKPNVNVTTCEDPVEYQIPGIVQVKINPDVGCTFAAALRAILRQDPDIVLIGEIRDAETCEIAIKAALTGHLVLSTLHANDAAGTITRLLDMGMEPFLLASSLILTQAQRLFRRLCQVCREPIDAPMDVVKKHKLDPAFFEGGKIYKARGCPKCHNLGYRGRGAIMEVMPIDDEIRVAIMKQETSDQIREKAIAKGMTALQESALEQVKNGVTSLEVALKVAGSEID